MTDCTKRIILTLLLWISEVRLISSSTPYCEYDTCDETQYCCGDYECCKISNNNVHIMIWVLVVLLVIALVLGVVHKCKSQLYRFFPRGSESESLNLKA